MSWWRLVAALAGLAAAVAGGWIAVAHRTPQSAAPQPGGVVWLVALVGLGVAGWVLYRHTRRGGEAEAPPWSSAGPIVEGTPEAAPRHAPLSGRALDQRLRAAATVARTQRDVEAGLSEVRPLLRAAYVDVARHDGIDEAEAESRLDRGDWTSDRRAAAALAADVTPPRRSLRVRVCDWLYPGRAVHGRVRAAVDALAEAADEPVTPVVGTDAPRQVPVHEPSLASRTRLADGRLDGPVPRTLERDIPGDAVPDRRGHAAVEDPAPGERGAGGGGA